MNEVIWRLIARLVSSPIGFSFAMNRAARMACRTHGVPWGGTGLPDILSADGQRIYMRRYRVFNPYPESWWTRWVPSIRLHHILLPDDDRHLHDHPWDARTIVLDGWYQEEREYGRLLTRQTGDTAALKLGEFHRITRVPYFGVYTLFLTWHREADWGFKVGKEKILAGEYLASREEFERLF